jgi:hypothetical protein
MVPVPTAVVENNGKKILCAVLVDWIYCTVIAILTYGYCMVNIGCSYV